MQENTNLCYKTVSERLSLSNIKYKYLMIYKNMEKYLSIFKAANVKGLQEIWILNWNFLYVMCVLIRKLDRVYI